MNIGSVVLYKNKPAVIKEINNDKIVIQLHGEEKKVRSKDFFILSDEPCSNLNNLLNAEITDPDFSEAVDFFSGEDPMFMDLVQLLWDDYSVDQIWKFWEMLVNSIFFVVTTPEMPIKIRSTCEVEEIILKEKEKANEEQYYNEFLVEIKKCLDNSDYRFDFSSYIKFLQEIEALALCQKEKSKILVDLKIKQSAENAHDILLKIKYWNYEKNPYPTRNGVSSHDAKAVIIKPVFEKKIIDLTHLVSYAIDNKFSTDPDDAICYDGKNLWVHVADPAETVIPDSESDLSARDRGVTLYLPETTAKMLAPEAVQYYALGLHQFSNALSFCIELNEDIEIENIQIMRTKIKVKRLTYEEAEQQKNTDELKPFFDLAEKLAFRREKNGAVSIKMPEVNIFVQNYNSTNPKVNITENIHLSSHEMVREMMLIAGEAGAGFAFKNSLPFQYVSQDAPTFPNNMPDGLAGEYKKRKSMKARSVSTTPSAHAALGISMYAQLTSPLRRYGDLVSHQQLLRFIDNEPLIPKDDFLQRLAMGDFATRKAMVASRLSRLHWTLVYFLQNSERMYEAVVLDVNANSTHIVIPVLAFEYDLKCKTKKELNEVITVMVESVNIPFQKVVLYEV